MKAHVAEWKKEEVKEITKLIKEYPVIGIVDMTNLPSAQLQKIKFKVKKDGIIIKVVKKRLIKLAIKNASESKKDVINLNEYLTGIPALIFSKNDPFKLSKIIAKNKSNNYIKPGQLAPYNIVIPEGPTPFTPGPMIGELGQIGLKVMVDKGKIKVMQEKVIAKAGEPVKANVAGIMAKLNIKPIEVGLKLVAAYENGIIYGEEVLSVDEKQYINKIKEAVKESFNLAINTAYVTKETVSLLLQKAFGDSMILSKHLLVDLTQESPNVEETQKQE